MRSRFKNKRQCRFVLVLTAGLLLFVFLVLVAIGGAWRSYDYKLLDMMYRASVSAGHGPKPSFMPRILYLTVTDTAYDDFGKYFLDRRDLARINDALAESRPEAVAFDLIFSRPGIPASDAAFAASIQRLAAHSAVYLPVGFAVSETPAAFRWETVKGRKRRVTDKLGRPVETGAGTPYHAVRAVVQQDRFAAAATGAGDISAQPDPDSVYRHLPLLVKVGDGFMPALSLAVFLDWAGVTLPEVTVHWGHRLIVPAAGSDRLTSDLAIPIDERGRAFVPFVARMGEDFPEIPAHRLLELSSDPAFRGNLLDRFEGNVVLVADVAVGISDLGATPLEEAVSLVTLHAAMLNGMLTQTFYSKWSFGAAISLILTAAVLFAAAALFRSSWPIYGIGIAVAAGLIGLTWSELVQFRLLPVMTVGAAALAIFFGLVIGLEAATSRERSVIRHTFSRYVPASVVNELLDDPEAIRLGGEERVLTVLFSDLADFTTISESMSPTDLVGLLNEYFTEMTAIITAQGGIIDKFQGDAVMAEFGMPLPIPDHANRAAASGLAMLKRLAEMRKEWDRRGTPALFCRVGINTGRMVVGNMGSKDLLDYTVTGDAVNLASRLEGVNKWYGTSLMISQSTHDLLTPGRFRSRIVDIIRVKGKTEPVRVYEVYGRTDELVDVRVEEYSGLYADAFGAYLATDFDRAESGFQKALSLKPEDPASTWMIERIRKIRENPLNPGWDGSIQLKSK